MVGQRFRTLSLPSFWLGSLARKGDSGGPVPPLSPLRASEPNQKEGKDNFRNLGPYLYPPSGSDAYIRRCPEPVDYFYDEVEHKTILYYSNEIAS